MTAGPSASPATSYGWRLGTLRGIPIYLGRSWPVFAIFVIVTFGPRVVNPSTFEQGGSYGYAVGLGYALLLLASVLVHEGAHAVTASRLGHRVDRVVADLLGGHTVFDSGRSRPGASAGIAVAGPVANLVLAAVGYGLHGVLGDGTLRLLVGAVAVANLFVGAFNLLPGLPLDGGFIVDALVWKVTGDRNKGLIVAGWVGRVLTVVVVVWYVGQAFIGGRADTTTLLTTFALGGLIGAFLWAGATNAIRVGTSGRAMARVPLMRVLRPVAGAGLDEPLGDVLRRVGGFGGLVVAWDRSGRPVGLVDVAAAQGIDAESLARGVRLEAVVLRQPEGWVITSDARADISGVIEAIVARAGSADTMPQVALVVDPQGRPLGSVSLDDLQLALDGTA